MMSGTYLDFEAKYFPAEWLEAEYLKACGLELIESKADGYMRLYLSETIDLAQKMQLIEDWVFEQSKIWAWEHYSKPYCSLLPTSYCQQMAEAAAEMQKKEENLLRTALRTDLRSQIGKNRQINISGYLYFAAERWKQLMQNFIYEIYLRLEEEIEQEEFIALLQYFVRTQVSLLDKVYLNFDSKGNFRLHDELGHNLREEYLQQLSAVELEEIGEIDLLMSILVTLLPQKIYLHLEDDIQLPQLELLYRVFGQRVISW